MPAAGVSSLYLARVCSDSAAEGGWARAQARTRDTRVMTDTSHKKEGFKKCRSATFSIDGYSFTIVANEAGDKNARPLARFSRSKSQNCLWNSLIDGLTGNVKEKPRPTIVQDTRPPEEILADELPQLDSPEALVKTSFRFGG